MSFEFVTNAAGRFATAALQITAVCVAIAAAVSAACSTREGSLAGEKVVVAFDEWMPYSGAHDGVGEGYLVDAVRAAFEREGAEVVIMLDDWDKCVEAAKNGEADALVCVTESEAYEAKLIANDSPMGYCTGVLVGRAGTQWRWNGDTNGLVGVKIGLNGDYGYDAHLYSHIDKYGKDESAIKWYSGGNVTEVMLAGVEGCEIDAMVEDYLVYAYYVKRSGSTSTKVVGSFCCRQNLYVGFSDSPRGRRLAATLDAYLEETVGDTGELPFAGRYFDKRGVDATMEGTRPRTEVGR